MPFILYWSPHLLKALQDEFSLQRWWHMSVESGESVEGGLRSSLPGQSRRSSWEELYACRHEDKAHGFTDNVSFSFYFLNLVFVLFCILGEGNSTPLQYSCLENPMDRGAWWARAHGPQSRTRLSSWHAVFLAFQTEPSAQLSTRLHLADSQLGGGDVSSADGSPPQGMRCFSLHVTYHDQELPVDDAGTLSPECQTFLKTMSASPPAPRASPQPSLNGALAHVFSELLPLPSVEQYHLKKGRCSKQSRNKFNSLLCLFSKSFHCTSSEGQGRRHSHSFPRCFAIRRGLLWASLESSNLPNRLTSRAAVRWLQGHGTSVQWDPGHLFSGVRLYSIGMVSFPWWRVGKMSLPSTSSQRVSIYRVVQKVGLGFPIPSYRKAQMDFLANPR